MSFTIDQCFSIDYVNKRIYDPGTNPDVFTVRELYSYLQNTFDELAQLDDTIPMSAQTPTDFTVINKWFIDDTSIKYLKGGAIKTDSSSSEIYVLNFGTWAASLSSTDITKVLTDGGTHTGTILAYDNVGHKIWVRAVVGIFANSDSCTITGGTAGTFIVSASNGVNTGEDIFPNIYTLGSIDQTYSNITNAQKIYIIQNEVHLTEWWPDPATPTNRQIDVLIKTQEAGDVIDSGNLTIFLRHYPSTGTASGEYVDLYDNFVLSAVLSGRNAVPLATANDLNNTLAHADVDDFVDIKIVFVNGTLTRGAFTIGTAYTALEVVNQASSGASARFISDATGTLTLGNVQGVFDNSGAIVGATSAASAPSTGTLTLDNTTRVTQKAFTQGIDRDYSVIIDCATHRMTQVYEYLKYFTRIGATGANFKTYMVQRTAVATWAINQLDGEQYIEAYEDLYAIANTYAPVKQSPFGTFAGGKLFGARGVWLQNMDPLDVQAFQLIDAGGTTREPPVQIGITVTNTLASDRVSVFATTGGDQSTTIWKEQYTSNATLNITNSTQFVVQETLPSDTPSTGSIRVVKSSDYTSTRESRYTYSSWLVSTLSGISPVLERAYAGTDTAYIPYIDAEASGSSIATTVIYASTTRYVLIRVRRNKSAAILPFETPGSIGSNGMSQATIRTPDTITLPNAG